MTADVVIVGGGVIGLAVASELGRVGAGRIVLLERSAIAAGSTGASLGGFRSAFASPVHLAYSLASVPRLPQLAAEAEVDVALERTGYLFLALDAHAVAELERVAARATAHGVSLERMTPAAIGERWPYLSASDVLSALHCADDGHVSARALAQAYAILARRFGVEVRTGVAVEAIERDGRRVVAVRAGGERIATRVVVDAAGPWAAEVAALAGVAVPLSTPTRHVFVTSPAPGIEGVVPKLVEVGRGWVFRREGTGFLTYGAQVDGAPGEAVLDWRHAPAALSHAQRRVPGLGAARLERGWAGLYDLSPDSHAILGAVDEVEGLILACGFSGHGVMHSPLTGKLIAELVTEGRTRSLDIAPFSLSRFARGAALVESMTAHLEAPK